MAQRHFNHVASMRGLVHGLRLRLDRNKSACFDFDGAITGTEEGRTAKFWGIPRDVNTEADVAAKTTATATTAHSRQVGASLPFVEEE